MNNDLKEYLESLYPAADDEEIAGYLELVLNHDEDRLPPTQAVLRYKEVTKLRKSLEAEEELLKKEIIEQYKRLNHKFDGLNISNPQPKSYDKEKLLSWALSNLPQELLDECKRDYIDESRLLKLVYEEKIDITAIPQDIYKKGDQYRVEVAGSRKKKE